MPPRVALRLTDDLIALASQFAGVEDAGDTFEGTPFAVITVISPTEINMKLMSEDQMLDEYKNDSDLHIFN